MDPSFTIRASLKTEIFRGSHKSYLMVYEKRKKFKGETAFWLQSPTRLIGKRILTLRTNQTSGTLNGEFQSKRPPHLKKSVKMLNFSP